MFKLIRRLQVREKSPYIYTTRQDGMKTKKNHKRVVSSYMWSRFPLIYINFNFDFLDLHNVFFENYFANKLTRSVVFEAM
jgi:hypothetical protein